MGIRAFFRQFIPITPRDDIFEASFNLAYNMNGGITWGEIPRIRKGKFLKLLKRLHKQLKMDNDAVERAKNTSKSRPTGRMKLLGR